MIIPINLGERSYDIIVERGALNIIEEYLNLNRKVLIVTDDGVPEFYAKTVAEKSKDATIVTLPQGENTKSIECYSKLLSVMLDKGFTRKDLVVAVGGGVIGDLSGFVAASYMRGVDFYNIPTTTLSQIDSSIGGKTAINFDGIKNVVGAFYQPKRVVIDPDLLKTLDKRQISAGLVEAVKMSLTSNKELFKLFVTKDIDKNLDTIIIESLKIKKQVVEQDEKEQGLRKILNFGHTLGHGIESELEHKDYYHGECVALGMIPMCSDAVRESLIKVLNKLDLKTKVSFNKDDAINAIKHDKKSNANTITVVKVLTPGSFVLEDTTIEQLAEDLNQIKI